MNAEYYKKQARAWAIVSILMTISVVCQIAVFVCKYDIKITPKQAAIGKVQNND